jgi:hypothetical protein
MSAAAMTLGAVQTLRSRRSPSSIATSHWLFSDLSDGTLSIAREDPKLSTLGK